MVYRVFLVGFGNVGRELANLLVENPWGLPLRIVGASSSRGSVILEGSTTALEELARLARSERRLESHRMFREGLGAVEAALESRADIAAITIPPSYGDGEPNRTIYRGLLEGGISIVTADKTVLALDYEGIHSLAAAEGLCLGYRATVAAGTPALDAARGLRLRGVERVRAILNATTNYILGLVEDGTTFEEAVERAIRAKLAEPDPTVDTHGWDPAAKLAILSSTLGYTVSLRDVERVPLDTISEEEVREALARGRRVKYVAEADYTDGRLRVAPMLLDAGDPLALAEGEENVVVFSLEDTNIVLRGPAGPAWRTARVMVTDLAECLNGLS